MAIITNDRDTGLQARGVNARVMNPSVDITTASSPAGFSYFNKPANSATLTPTSLTLTANATSSGSYTSPTYKWEYSTAADPVTWVLFAGETAAALTITNTNFKTIVGSGNSLNIRVTVSQGGWSTLQKITALQYYREASPVPEIEFNRPNITLPVSTAGVISYTGTETLFRVKINNVYIPYGATGANTYSITAAASSTPNTVTAGTPTTITNTVTNDTRRFDVISNVGVSAAPATITYTITVRDADNIVTTFTRLQTIVISLSGANAKTLSVSADSDVFKADSNNTLVSSVIKLTASKQNTSAAVTWSFSPAVVVYNAATGGSAVTSGDVVYLRSADYGTNTAVQCTASIAADSLSDTTSILRVKDGSYGLTAVLNNPSAPLPTTTAGVVTYTGSGTTIKLYEGSTLLIITAVSASVTNITAGAISGLNTTTVTYGNHSAITQDNASIVYTVTGTRGDSTSGTTTVTQALYKSKQGATGNDGNKFATVSAFKWAASGAIAPTASGTADYTWLTNSYSAPPTDWTSAAGAAPANNYVLYQVSLVVTAAAGATTTPINWASAPAAGSIGYRIDGTIGPTGGSARTAFIKTTTPAIPTPVTPGGGDEPPTNSPPDAIAISGSATPWSFTAFSAVEPGQYMYRVDGIYTNGQAIAWGTPYLAYLKVGSLSALSADLGTVDISSTGSLATKSLVSPFTDRKAYGSSQAGVFLGYHNNTYKFDVGNGTNYMRWDGTALVASGITVKDTSGNIILSTGSSLQSQIAGGNILANSDLSSGVANWTIGTNPSGGTNYTGPTWDIEGDSWKPAGGHSVGFSRSGSTSTAASYLDIKLIKNIAVISSTVYEISTYIASHRCVSALGINYYNSAGTLLTSTVFTRSTTTNNGGNSLSSWERVGGFINIPATCTQVSIFIRGYATTSSDPYVWATRFFMAQAATNQTTLSNWSGGNSTGAFSELDKLTAGTASTYIADAAIGNAQIGGSIYSNNYYTSGGASGWLLDRAGNLIANSGTFRGSLSGADITGSTGTFSGTVTAGSVNFASSVGTTTTVTTPGWTYITNPALNTQLRITAYGGGGGGGGGLNSGGNGGGQSTLVTNIISVTGGESIGIFIGAGGAGGGVGSNGSAGQTTTITVNGTTVFNAPGGAGGAANAYLGAPEYFPDYMYDGSLVSGGPSGGYFGQNGAGVGGGLGSYRATVNYLTIPATAGQPPGKGGGGGFGHNYAPGSRSGGAAGGRGQAIVETYDPNGVILRSVMTTLKNQLTAATSFPMTIT